MSNKVVLYSALVVEAPAGPGMWICKKRRDGICSGLPFKDFDSAFAHQVGGIKMEPVQPDTNFIYDIPVGGRFYNQVHYRTGEKTLKVFWTEPHNPVDEEAKAEGKDG